MIPKLLLAALFAACAFGQDYRSAEWTAPISTRNTTPGVCRLGQMFIRSDQAAGQNLYVCGSHNDWSLVGASGGGSATPGGSPGAVQFNEAGALGGDGSQFFWDSSTKFLSLGSAPINGVQDCASWVGVSNLCITSDNSSGSPFNALGIQSTGDSTSSSQGIYILSTSSNPDGIEVDTFRHNDAGNNVQTGFIYAPGASGTTVPGSGGVRAFQYSTFQGFNFGSVQEFTGADDANSTSVCVFCSALNAASGKTRYAINAQGTAPSYFGGPLIVALHTPASSSEACTAGQFSDDANFHYVCTATNTWKRVALSTF